ncbi:MAG: hypothetical protein RLZZ568_594 [Cyanobacteriota bacterium]
MALALPLVAARPSAASEFTETEIDQSQVIAVARPFGTETIKYDLLVIEQIPEQNQCWQTSGATPVMVDPLLLNYNFVGHCRRATDSNGYSVRIDGEDYGLEYLLRIVPKGDELVLVATSRTGNSPELILGSTQGLEAGFMQIKLKPGWQFTKRTYEDQVLGHFYISGSQTDVEAPGVATSAPPAVEPDAVQPEPVQPDAIQPDMTPVTDGSPTSEPEGETGAMAPDVLLSPPTEATTEQAPTVTDETLSSNPPLSPAVPLRGDRRRRPTPDSFRGV